MLNEKPFAISGPVDQPLQLAMPDFDYTRNGYNMRDTNVVLAQHAQAAKAGFLDTLELLKINTREHTVDSFFEATERPTLVTGEVPLYPNEPGGLQVLETIMELISQSQQATGTPRKVIIPLNIAYMHGEKENHAMVLLIEKREEHYDIALLEQHARRDGSKLDFSNEKSFLINYLHTIYPQAEITQNEQPFCTVERSCGIATLAVCKKLLMEKDSVAFAADVANFLMDQNAVNHEHAANVILATKAAAHDGPPTTFREPGLY